MRTLRTEVVVPLVVVALAFSGCTGEAGDIGSSVPDGVGRVQAELLSTNNTIGTVQVSTSGGAGMKSKVTEIIVTVAKVTVHSSAGGWQTISSKETTVDILKLSQYSADLGFKNIPAGKVTQVRLYLAENAPQYVTRDDGARIELKVPSGYQSGIKIHGLFDVAGCNLTSVPLEIDGKKSIWVHPTGQGDLWILRPVIRLGRIEASNVGCTPITPLNPGTGGGIASGAGGGSGGTTGTGGGIAGTGGGIAGTGGGTPGFPEGPGTGSGGNLPGTIPMGGSGATCSNGLGCLSGVCLSGICGKGGPDAPCAIAVDCASNVCSSGTCTAGTAGGTGTTCSLNSMCLSNGCVNGTCGEGGQGQPCAAAIDCAMGFSCMAGSCTSPIN